MAVLLRATLSGKKYDRGPAEGRCRGSSPASRAPLAELADAHASGACIRKDIEVQILWGAHEAGYPDNGREEK